MLIRSPKSVEFPTRIDVFFKGVKEIHLPTTFTGLSMTEASESEAEELGCLPPRLSFGDNVKVFRIQGDKFVGYVVALVAVCSEDDGEYNDPSPFAKENLI